MNNAIDWERIAHVEWEHFKRMWIEKHPEFNNK